MVCHVAIVARSKVKVTGCWILPFSNSVSSAISSWSWQVRTKSKFVWAGFLMSVLVFCHVTLNLEELGSQEESVGLIWYLLILYFLTCCEIFAREMFDSIWVYCFLGNWHTCSKQTPTNLSQQFPLKKRFILIFNYVSFHLIICHVCWNFTSQKIYNCKVCYKWCVCGFDITFLQPFSRWTRVSWLPL